MPTIPILADSTSGSNVTYWLAVILVAAGLGLIVLVLLGMRRGFGPAPAPMDTLGLDATSGVGTTQEAERLLRLMGEAEEVCTRLGRDLDDKAMRLERLLARAEGMLSEPGVGLSGGMGAATMGQGSSDGLYSPNGAGAGVGGVGGVGGFPTRPEIVTRPVGVPTPPQPVGYAATYAPQRTPQATQPSPAQAVFGPQHGPAASAPQPTGADPEAMAQQIFRLADAGLTPGEIAQRLGQHTGKVELIIALRNT